MPNLPLIQVEDYRMPAGWVRPEQRDARARAYCELLEGGQILSFRELPYLLPAEDREFLLAQEWTELRLHKNVSYRPADDILRGVAGDAKTVGRLHAILRNYSAQTIEFLRKFLAPYASRWVVDFASFRPLEEQDRNLPL
ncbi:MAG: Kdo hydroxylase family protein, partial [Candidatus Acidiferrales bacterium]